MDIENLHIIDNHTIFYEGNKHYFIYPSNDGYTMAIEEISFQDAQSTMKNQK